MPERDNIIKLLTEREGPGAAERAGRMLLAKRRTEAYKPKKGGLKDTTGQEARIELVPGATPYAQNVGRVNEPTAKLQRDFVKEGLEKGILEPSESPWAAGVVIVSKKDGGVRICCDFRQLNKVTKSFAYPLPRIDDTIQRLGGMKYVSTVDLKAAYWQIPMAEEDREKTAFATVDGLFQWRVLPFGLKNAVGIFSRFMARVVGSLRHSCVLVYIDDCLVYSKSFDDHLRDVGNLLDRLVEWGVELKQSKCFFFRTTVDFLGHRISDKGIAPDPKKIEAISKMPRPPDRSAMKAFLGMTGYYRTFIEQYSTTAHPLVAMTASKEPYPDPSTWNPEQIAAFESLKSSLTCSPILGHPNWSLPFEVHCDASPVGLGATLVQRVQRTVPSTEAGVAPSVREVDCVIQYASRSLRPAETRYHQYEKEFLSMAWSIKTFRSYIVYTQFTVVTDNTAVTAALQRKGFSRVTKWILALQEYDFVIKHRPGSKHGDADGPSRNPIPAAPPTEEELDAELYQGRNPISAAVSEDPVAVVSAFTRSQIAASQRSNAGGLMSDDDDEDEPPAPEPESPGADSTPAAGSEEPQQPTRVEGDSQSFWKLADPSNPDSIALAIAEAKLYEQQASSGSEYKDLTWQCFHEEQSKDKRCRELTERWLRLNTLPAAEREQLFTENDQTLSTRKSFHDRVRRARVRASQAAQGAARDAVPANNAAGQEDDAPDLDDVRRSQVEQRRIDTRRKRMPQVDAALRAAGSLMANDAVIPDAIKTRLRAVLESLTSTLQTPADEDEPGVVASDSDNDEDEFDSVPDRRTIREFNKNHPPRPDSRAFYNRHVVTSDQQGRSVLFDLHVTARGSGAPTTQRRIVVPPSMVESVLSYFHGLPVCGHLGRTKTTANLSRYFYWKGMTNDIARWIRACAPCQQRKPPRSNRVGMTKPMSSSGPGQIWCMDFVGPFPETPEGFKWILTLHDQFTRWPIAVPTKHRDVGTVFKCVLHEVVYKHGPPEVLFSDREPGFAAKAMKKICERYNIKKSETTGYQPQANSSLERFHSYLAQALTFTVNRHKSDWAEWLESVLWIYRTSVNETTGYSPFFLTYGRHPRVPLAAQLGLGDQSKYDNEESYGLAASKALEEAHRDARLRQLAAKFRDKQRRDASRVDESEWATDGAMVMFWEPEKRLQDGDSARPRKLEFRWSGPYRVARTCFCKLHRYILHTGREKLLKVNVNRLRVFHPWTSEHLYSIPPNRAAAESPDAFEEDDHAEYEWLPENHQRRLGDFVIVPVKAHTSNPMTFAVGRVLHIRDGEDGDGHIHGKYTVQWYSNSQRNPLGNFLPVWLEPAKAHRRNKLPTEYFARHRKHASHQPYTNETRDMAVNPSNCINIAWQLDANDKIPSGVLDVLSNHKAIQWARPQVDA